MLDHIWAQITTVQTAPAWWVSLATLTLAFALVVPHPAWRISRNVVTIAHEGGHALAAILTGRRLDGIRLHSDTSGVTVSAGKPHGPGMILTAFAGYVAPSLVGLGAAALVAHGRALLALWVTTALLALMLVMIRNVFGALTITLTGALVFAVSWWTPNIFQMAFVLQMTWFLLVAGPLPVWELQQKRAQGLAEESDADQLAALTGIPGIVWVLLFGLVNVAALGYAARLIFF
jgi:hypothetical protein